MGKSMFFGRKAKKDPDAGMTKKSRDVKQSKEIAKIKKTIAVLKPEHKVLSPATVSGTGLVQSTPVINLLNGMSQGNGQGARVASKVTFLKMDLRWQMFSANALTTPTGCRVLIVQDKQPEGSSVTPTDLFGTTGPAIVRVYNYVTRDFSRRFHILYDKTFVLSPSLISSAVTQVNNGATPSNHYARVLKNMKLKTGYDRGNNGDITDIDVNSLHIVFMTDSSVVNSVSYSYDWNLFYTDS